jgi:hypothetical protein
LRPDRLKEYPLSRDSRNTTTTKENIQFYMQIYSFLSFVSLKNEHFQSLCSDVCLGNLKEEFKFDI